MLALPSVANAQDRPRTSVTPYIEVSQTLDADLKGGDTVTYTSVAAGVDAAVTTARINGQISYRYEHRFGEGHDLGDDDIHTGLARVDAKLTPALTFEAGGIATRARSDIRGAAPGVLVGNVDNVSQLYGVYAGPTLATQLGVVNVGAAYQIGYTKVETPTYAGPIDGQRLDYYDHSLGQLATATVGIAPGTVLPVGVTLSGLYEREDGAQLGQRFEGYHGRGDVLLPVSPNVALTAGVGYERIEASQRDPLLTAGGTPVLDGNGRFETDPNSPRRIAYRTDGVYYDAGVVWRPDRRTSVEAHVGRRYGSLSYTGTATYQASKTVGFAVNVYDSVQTFGQQLRQGVAALPTSFVSNQDPFSQQFNGCVFGTSGGAPGGCLDSVFQSITTASYRARGVDAVGTITRGLSTFGVGIGYANRRLYAPTGGSGIVVYGDEDESYYGQLFWARSLSRNSGLDVNAFVDYYTTQLSGGEGTWSYGATGSYYRNFGRLSTTASVGLYSFKVGDLSSDVSLQALLGARYHF
nr:MULTISPECIES: hypothetical protein [unclassified Sphingomonas]